MAPVTRTIHTGVVHEFDDPRGLGTVLGDDGRRYGFHCTAIADGTRHIDVGARVTFILVAGHLGRVEARDIHQPTDRFRDGAGPDGAGHTAPI
jgi:cold shock CspA family protein